MYELEAGDGWIRCTNKLQSSGRAAKLLVISDGDECMDIEVQEPMRDKVMSDNAWGILPVGEIIDFVKAEQRHSQKRQMIPEMELAKSASCCKIFPSKKGIYFNYKNRMGLEMIKAWDLN